MAKHMMPGAHKMMDEMIKEKPSKKKMLKKGKMESTKMPKKRMKK